jgi:hypothetical protein
MNTWRAERDGNWTSPHDGRPGGLADRAGVPRAGACIREGTRPEVDGERARHDVALDYAIFESHVAGRLVTIAEVELGAVGA